MGVARVRAPDGRVWVVKRRLRWPKRRDTGLDVPWDLIDGFDDAVVAVVGLVAAALIAVFILLLLPLILFVLEALLVLGGVLILRGTWVVEASTVWPTREVKTWRVRGWGASRRAADEVVRELQLGVAAAPAEGEAEPVGG